MSYNDTFQQPPPPVPAGAGLPAYAPPPPRKRNWGRILLIACLIPIGIFAAFLALGLFLVAIGYESGSDGDLAVDGAEVTDEYVGANDGTTWTVVTDDEDPSQDELIAIATAFVSLPEVEPLLNEGLDILIYDEGGRQLRNFNENLQELDQAGADGDIEKILELAQDFPQEWIDDHSVATVSATLDADGMPSYVFCPLPVGGADCSVTQRTLLVPAP